ncbi:nucleotide-diphospho-sugar transferase [Coemansia reversa NRRL 1564]|uniref:mannose-1-phosphate guanylyltransferase n=1 Tax=Coemansia reversa (strain ATCC 12441 / NRRL 1564) TaxID=763665 RepID=A0A2G5BKA9_COERN|nr:nucleotide-diphospho-sugar transferase [Coemansia reversa NRRL 1564]|eukprot:PIA19177.1 nucleotide-diphospho-sugar transferase [Coemansia reversa NRRL 1564]
MNKAVILVGGPSRATRFRPLSMHLPQPLFPVGGQPIIWHQIKALSAVKDLREIILIGFFEDFIFQPFLSKCQDEFPSVTFKYLREYSQLGTAGGFFHFRDQILRGSPKNIFMLYTDICCSFPLNELLAQHERHGRLGTIMVTKVDRASAHLYGCVVVDHETKLAEHYVEKPETYVSDMASTGVFVFDQEIFHFMARVMEKRASEFEHERVQESAYGRYDDGDDSQNINRLRLEQDVLRAMAADKKLSAFLCTGFWRQIKSAASAVPANALYLQQAHESSDIILAESSNEGAEIKGAVYIHPSAQVHPTAHIGPNVSIHARVVIGPGVRINDSIILDNVHIKDNAVVLHAIVGWDCRIGKWGRVEGSKVTKANDIDEVTQSGVKLNSICILGEDVHVKDEVFIRNSIVLPHKELAGNKHNEVIM